jgi:survival-of-motor-neuron-related-splicing factor 30
MSDARSQLAEVHILLAAAPDDPALHQLRDDLLQLIALEEHEILMAGGTAAAQSSSAPLELEPTNTLLSQLLSESAASASASSTNYTAQGTFLDHTIISSNSDNMIAEAPDLGSFQPVVKNAAKSPSALKSSDDDNIHAANATKDSNTANTNTANATTSPASTEKKSKKKKKVADNDNAAEAVFELPSHLVPLESDTPAQRLKKQRTAKALKSKFREKQKEAEHAKRQNDWKSFASKAAGGKKRKGGGGNTSIFSTEDGVNARVGVISGGGGRTMTNFVDPNKRHK